MKFILILFLIIIFNILSLFIYCSLKLSSKISEEESNK